LPEKDRSVKVLFKYEGSHKSVCLSGDFNGWSSTSHCLDREGDQWTIEVLLAPGRYRYGFILDGETWTSDPNALLQEDNGFGRKNSVLIVE
jgi:1,4-alpha-glucan branching enzyme